MNYDAVRTPQKKDHLLYEMNKGTFFSTGLNPCDSILTLVSFQLEDDMPKNEGMTLVMNMFNHTCFFLRNTTVVFPFTQTQNAVFTYHP